MTPPATHYNYFRDYDPAIGRYAESDPIGLQGGLNTYGYVSSNPARLVDPRGLSALGDYADCLSARAMDPFRNCNLTLFASATESAGQQIEAICKVINKTLVCTAVCGLKEIFGANIQEFAWKAHKEAAKRALEKVARETASKFIRKAVPVVNVIDTIGDVYGTIVCTVNCAQSE